MARKQVTLSDIAEVCGTSNVTVSKALSGKDGVGDELREKIKSVAREMGYIPAAKYIPSENIGNIGVIIPEKFLTPVGTFYSALSNRIMKRLKQDNISCIQENISEDEEASLILPNILANGKIAGLISLGQVSPEYLKMIMQKTNNLVLLDYYIPGIDVDCVISNGISGAYRITNHLIENGHKDIGFIGTRLATSSIFDRFTGFARAMLEHSLPIREEWIINDRKNDNMDFGEMDFPQTMPTAFVCNCDEIAFAAIRKLKSLGYSVPDDISVVGYDNFLISEIAEPQITTISVDATEIADTAVSMLIDRINNPLKKSEIRSISGNLEIKNSVKNIC
ncbi:MAG: LacI family DNA-binding transcriptional regulator [Oscillospiraceae bacterium]|nr:LacI family DNA-binding transcriptional regulator [Oscillospiraceae bacterium]